MTDIGTDTVTREQVEQVLALLRETFIADLGDLPADSLDAPHIYEPGFHANGWTIAWEGAYGWTYTFPHGGRDEEFGAMRPDVSDRVPAGLFLEPVSGWCLGIYPE